MAQLVYFMPASLDGYIADETRNPDWSAPDEKAFAFVTDLCRPIRMYLYGRKMYETMAVWETPRGHSWPDAGNAGLRAVLASGRQDRLLQIARDRFYTEDASGAGIPPAGSSRVEGSIASRRVSSTRRAYYAWRRHAGPAQQRTDKAGAPGRAPFCQWNGLSSLSLAGLMEDVAAGSELRLRFEVLLRWSKGLTLCTARPPSSKLWRLRWAPARV